MSIDFKQMMKEYHIDYSDEVNGWVNINCPICHHTGTRGYKGGFNIYNEYYTCWNCGWHPLEEVIESLLSVNYNEARMLIEKYSGSIAIMRKLNRRIKNNKAIELPVDYVNERAKKYLASRKYDPDYIIEKYKITGISLSGAWSYRIIIPIYYEGNIVSYQGRSLFNKEKCKELGILRYKNLSIEKSWIDPKHILYNLDNCKSNHLMLVEGVFDVWRIGDNCAATFGTSHSEEQIKLMAQRFKRVSIIFDPEKEAQERAIQLGKRLCILGVNVDIVDTEALSDPGDMTEKEVAELRAEIGF